MMLSVNPNILSGMMTWLIRRVISPVNKTSVAPSAPCVTRPPLSESSTMDIGTMAPVIFERSNISSDDVVMTSFIAFTSKRAIVANSAMNAVF